MYQRGLPGKSQELTSPCHSSIRGGPSGALERRQLPQVVKRDLLIEFVLRQLTPYVGSMTLKRR